MKSVLAVFRPMTPWQAAVLIIALVGSGLGSFAAYGAVDSASAVTLADNQQAIAVQRGELVNSVSINGTLIFPEVEQLRFATGGTVGEVMVAEGDSVTSGQSLATLDAAALVQLEEAVARARVNLDNAEQALTDASAPSDAVEIAEAEAKISKARLDVQAAEDALAAALEPFSVMQIRAQEEALAKAEADLKAAEDALVSSQTPFSTQQVLAQQEAVARAAVALDTARDNLEQSRSGLTVRTQEEAVARAQLDVEAAQEALDQARLPATTAAIASAEPAVEQATASLRTAEIALIDAQEAQPSVLEQAESAFDAAKFAYRQAITLKYGLGTPFPDTFLETDLEADILLDPTSFIALHVPVVNVDSVDALTPWKDMITVRDALNSAVRGQAVIDAERTVSQRQQAVEDAEDALAALLAKPDASEVALKQAQLATAQDDLQLADQDLAGLLSSEETADLLLKRAQVETAEADLGAAEETLGDMLAGADPLDVALKSARVSTAQATLDEAGEKLSDITAAPDPLVVADKQQAIVVASVRLDDGEEALVELSAGADSLAVALRATEVETARSALGTAIENLDGAVLRAPTAGLVTALAIEAGDQVGVNLVAIEVVDTSIAEVDGVIDEIDVLFVRIGTQAVVTMDALEGQRLRGVVSSIAATGTTQAGVVSFPIRVQVEAPQGVQLREGLSAAASVVIRVTSDALLVPSLAVGGSFLQPTVQVLSDGEIAERPVTLGDSDDFLVVVEDGVAEGDLVVVESADGAASPFGNFAAGQANTFRQLFGAGFGRGGGGAAQRGGGGQAQGGGGGR